MLKLNFRNVFSLAFALAAMWLTFFTSLNVIYHVLFGIVMGFTLANWLLYVFADNQEKP